MTAVSAAPARASEPRCPDFSGKYVDSSGVRFSFAQTGCERLEVTRQASPTESPSRTAYILDGKRHASGPYFWSAYWSTERSDVLVLEPWGTPEGGEMIGFPSHWQRFDDASGSSLREQIIDDSNPSGPEVIETIIYHSTR